MGDEKAVTPKTADEVLSEVVNRIIAARTLLEAGPTSGKARRVYEGEVDHELGKALDLVKEFRA